MYRKRSINASNENSNTIRNIHSGREIRDVLLQLSINVQGNFVDLNDSTIQTPRNSDQQENIESPAINSNLNNDNKSDGSCIITVHSSDT